MSYLTMKVYILKWKETVLCGRKVNVEYALFVRQTDESMWLRKVETWLLYFVLLTVFLQSHLRSKILFQSYIPLRSQLVSELVIKISIIEVLFNNKQY